MCSNFSNDMWCDLRKPVTWCKIDILKWLISCESLNHYLSSTFYLDLLWYWYQKLLLFKEYENEGKHQNYVVYFLHFAVSPFATCDRFSQITSHIMILILLGLKSVVLPLLVQFFLKILENFLVYKRILTFISQFNFFLWHFDIFKQ